MESLKKSNLDLTLHRRTKILDQLESSGQVKVAELSQQFNVSEVTIRNDLTLLEQKNLLLRARGGAIKAQRVAVDYLISVQRHQNHNEKEAIGRKAVELIENDDTIILDAGTTTMEIANNLIRFHNLTVITNALNIAVRLADLKNIKLIIPGGILRQNTFSLVGPSAEESIRNFYCDKVFLGANGINSQHGISTSSIEESYLNRYMISIAQEVIIVADSSKFQQRAFTFVAPISDINTIITDDKIPAEEKSRLEQAGVKVIIS
jgi:DeoR family transcriptional regulator of aga operon